MAAYNQFLQREQAKYRAMSAKKKYYTNRKFEDFRQAIWVSLLSWFMGLD